MSRAKYILGVTSPVSLNNAAVLLQGGEICSAVEEERFRNIKHAPNIPPTRAVEYCLDEEGITFEEVDQVAVGWGVAPDEDFSSELNYANHKVHKELMPNFLEYLNQRDPSITDRITYVNHNLSHAASAFYPSGFSNANVLSLDGSGDKYSGLIGFGDGDSIDVFDHIDTTESLGHFYGKGTDYLGFRKHSDEGKVMGLASYGDPKYNIRIGSGQKVKLINAFQDFNLHQIPIDWKTAKTIHEKLRFIERIALMSEYPPEPVITRYLNTIFPENINKKIVERLFSEVYYTGNGTALTEVHQDLAASIQHRLEKEVLDLAERLHNKTGVKKFALAGGVALNCTMNRKLLYSDFVEEIFIQPAAHDAGTALGAAMEVAAREGYDIEEMNHPYYGPSFDNDAIETMLNSKGIQYEYLEEPAVYAAQGLSEGQIIGWVQDRLEFGPRALGHRSILADPSNPDMKDKVNKKVKDREPWRPFAPSVLQDKKETLFENPHDSPFMTLTFNVSNKGAKMIPSATHINQTSRPQTVSKSQDEKYYRLIQEFYDITDIPAVLNTSYNIAGDPMNRTPQQALDTFQNSGIDELILSNYVLKKK